MSFSTITVRRDQTEVAGGGVLADRLVNVSKGTARQQHAILEEHAPVHGGAGHHVLRNSMVHETHRGDHLDLAALDVGFIDHATHPAEMIAVRVRVDHRHHRAGTQFLIDELQGGGGRLLGGQGIEDDPPRIALDKTDIGQIEAAHLIDLVRDHLIKTVGHIQDGLALE